MRIAVISDVHSNWPALEAVLEDLEGVDDVMCLGDVVGYGGQPLPCLDHLRGQGWLTLMGNHDQACTDAEALLWFNADAAAAVRWTAAQLDPDRTRWLSGLPETATREGALLVHASPRSHVHEYVLDRFTAAANLELLDGGVCFHGHTHLPGVFHVEQGKVVHDYRLGPVPLSAPGLVNPGSRLSGLG